MSSIARVIFLMDCVDRIRRRSTRICAAMGPYPSALGRSRLVDLDGLLLDLVVLERVHRGLLGHHRRAVGCGELLLEVLDQTLEPRDVGVVELAGVADLGERPL